MKCTCTNTETDLQGVEDGLKPLAIIYNSKTPIQYEEALKAYKSIHVWKIRFDVIAISQNVETLRTYVSLVSNRKYFSRKQYQRCMGKLLGYENHKVEEFIQSEIGKTCTCIECGGEL